MGNEYLDFNEIYKSKSEDFGASVRKSLYSNDDSVNFVTRMGIHLRGNDYYINKFSGLFKDNESKSEKEDEDEIESIYGDDYYDDGEKALEDLMTEFIDFDSGKEKKEGEKTKKTETTEDETTEDETKDDGILDEEEEEECDEVLKDFKKTVKTADCTKTEGMEKLLESIESNLNHAVTILNSKNEEGKKDKIAVKSSDIKGLLSQFKILKETEWDRPTKYIPKDDTNPYYKASRAIYRTQFFDAYESIVKEVLDKFPNNPQGKEAEIVKTLLLTLRPTKEPERHKTNTGEYAYNEIKAYAKISDNGYDEEYDTRVSTIEIKGDFTFKKNEDSNKILNRLIAVLLERANCTGTLKTSFVDEVFSGEYEFDYQNNPIWGETPMFGKGAIGKVEENFDNLEENSPIKMAYKQFKNLIFKKLKDSPSLDRMQTEDLIEAFVGEEVECQTVLKFLGLGKITKDEKYKKLFEKLKLEVPGTDSSN